MTFNRLPPTMDHLTSSTFVKLVHQELRKNSKRFGAEQAWKEHCEDKEILKKYAEAMHNLATSHWESSFQKNLKTVSRVEWVFTFIKKYFYDGVFLIKRQKELRVAAKNNIILNVNNNLKNLNMHYSEIEKIKLLDVGSCYSPFRIYNCFDVLAIDIAPATADVHQCDFLSCALSVEDTHIQDGHQIDKLQLGFFDVVVFSLFLEYLPLPNQRHMCCEKAYNLLKTEGLLIIITPDSKHVGANSKFMKTWRFLLSKLGFCRIKYDKLPHLHCMAFRKSLCKSIGAKWSDFQEEVQFFSQMYIPQDLNLSNKDKPLNVNNVQIACDPDLFMELPTGF